MGTIKQNFKSGHFFINIKIQISRQLTKSVKKYHKRSYFHILHMQSVTKKSEH